MSGHTETALQRRLASCHVCCQLASIEQAACPRCGASLHARKQNSLQYTAALLITAAILYLPANLYPIMITDALGQTEESTIVGGVVLLINLGSIPVAMVIFVASVVVPVGKLVALSYLGFR